MNNALFTTESNKTVSNLRSFAVLYRIVSRCTYHILTYTIKCNKTIKIEMFGTYVLSTSD